MILALTLYLLLASGEMFLLLVTCYQSGGLHGLGLTRGKETLTPKSKKGCLLYNKNKIIFALV
jgi:hypothetical protein